MPVTPPQDDPTFFAELRDSRKFDASNGVLTGEMHWRVPARGVEAATFPGLPFSGSDFPGSTPGSCTLDRISCGQILGLYAQEVVGYYSSDGRYRRSPTRPVADTTRGYLTITYERADLQIPFFTATRRTVPKYTTNPTTGVRTLSGVGDSWEWLPCPIKTKVIRRLLNRQITLQTLDLPTITAINNQLGDIHTFPDGSQWMFNVPTIAQIGPTTWTVYYQWEGEYAVPIPGTPPLPSSPSIPAFVASRYYITALEVRPPFYAYQVIPGAFRTTIPDGTGSTTDLALPEVVVFDKFPTKRSNPTGWATLPGNPLSEYV